MVNSPAFVTVSTFRSHFIRPSCHPKLQRPPTSYRVIPYTRRFIAMCAEPPSAKSSKSQSFNAEPVPESIAKPIDTGELQLGGGSGGMSGGQGGGDGSGDDGGDGSRTRTLILIFSEQVKNVQQLAQKKIRGVGRISNSAYATVVTWSGQLFNNVPAPVLVALISLFSTVQGARYKARVDKASAERAQMEAARKKRDEIEQALRKEYADIAAPILKSAAKLAERLQLLVDSEWDRVERVDVAKSLSPVYSAYLLGRYLATVEIMKRERTLLDYGFPAGDRILSNILGRIQGVLCANDELLIEMQQTEHLFQPRVGEKPLSGGALRITPRAQTVLGELLLRKTWKGKSGYVQDVEQDEMHQGPKAVISFLEFSRIMKEDSTMRHWYKAVVDEFKHLEKTVQRVPKTKRRCNAVGSRVYFLQSALLDLVEFFDPLPHAQAIPFYRRRRLQLGQMKHSEEQRSPLSLYKLYNELANVRDHRVLGGNARDRLRLPGGQVEVHVKASPFVGTGDASIMPTKHGDCPFSQRVLIVLEELEIPYRAVFIPAKSKPAWFYLLHPENMTPVVYHDGNLVENSKHIVSYLMSRFPETGKTLGSAEKLRLAVGTDVFTKFHDRFKNWIIGNEAEKAELERELRSLDTVIARAQQENDGLPFLGGDRFAREDTAIAPMLNNVEVAGKALKQWRIPADCKALRKYLHAAREVPSFAKTVGDEDAIVAGYGHLKVKGGERTWRLADMLE